MIVEDTLPDWSKKKKKQTLTYARTTITQHKQQIFLCKETYTQDDIEFKQVTRILIGGGYTTRLKQTKHTSQTGNFKEAHNIRVQK